MTIAWRDAACADCKGTPAGRCWRHKEVVSPDVRRKQAEIELTSHELRLRRMLRELAEMDPEANR